MSDEMIDIFNEHGDRLGVRPRLEAHSQGLWHRGVHCFLFNSSGQLLVQRRSESCDTFPNAYDCSISEHLCINESFKEALIRGCREELCTSPTDLKRLISYKMNYGPTDNMICELYSAEIDESNLQCNKSEVAEIEFFEMADILELQNAKAFQFTSWFQQQLNWFNGKPHGLEIS